MRTIHSPELYKFDIDAGGLLIIQRSILFNLLVSTTRVNATTKHKFFSTDLMQDHGGNVEIFINNKDL